MKDAFRHAI